MRNNKGKVFAYTVLVGVVVLLMIQTCSRPIEYQGSHRSDFDNNVVRGGN